MAKKLAVKISRPISVIHRLALAPIRAPTSIMAAPAATTRPRPKRPTNVPALALDHVPDKYNRKVRPASDGGRPKSLMARKPKKLYMDTNTPMPKKAVLASATMRGLVRWPAIARNSAPGRMLVLAWKLRCSGNSHQAASASERLMVAVAARAQRHEATSSTKEGMRRPMSPPMVLPAM